MRWVIELGGNVPVLLTELVGNVATRQRPAHRQNLSHTTIPRHQSGKSLDPRSGHTPIRDSLTYQSAWNCCRTDDQAVSGCSFLTTTGGIESI